MPPQKSQPDNRNFGKKNLPTKQTSCEGNETENKETPADRIAASNFGVNFSLQIKIFLYTCIKNLIFLE